MLLPEEKSISRTKAPPVPEQLRLQARRSIATYIELARRTFGVHLGMPTCSFDLRGTTAGKAHLQKYHVQLNSVLYQENVQDFLEQTIPHEVAHLVTYALHGRKAKAHGAEWQSIMRAMGVRPERCHTYDTTNSAVSRAAYKFKCACRTFEFSSRRYKRGLAGHYSCTRCNSKLQFAGEVKKNGEWSSVTIPREASHPGQTHSTAVSADLPPTRPMLDYMIALARRLGVQVTAEMQSSRKECSLFISQAKAQLESSGVANGPSGRSSPPIGADDSPTERQLSYARSIAQRRNLVIPPEVLSHRKALSRWIDLNH